jgi:aminoglycoside phosphotransferase (APT) family kinase protein
MKWNNKRDAVAVLDWQLSQPAHAQTDVSDIMRVLTHEGADDIYVV